MDDASKLPMEVLQQAVKRSGVEEFKTARLEFDVYRLKDRAVMRFERPTDSLILTPSEARRLALVLRQFANQIERQP